MLRVRCAEVRGCKRKLTKAALVSDHGDLQKCAHDKRISHQLVKIVQDLDDEDIVGEIGMDLASRSKEVRFTPS